MSDDDIEIRMDGSPDKPRVVEIDASIIATIIMNVAQAEPATAARAANVIVDYLAEVHRNSMVVN